jgi:hypothetical protein
MAIKKALEFLKLLLVWLWSGERAENGKGQASFLKTNPA